MGEVLVRHGRLTAPDLKRAIGFAVRDGKRLGTVLVELGLLPADQIEDALALHVHEILAKVFSWSDGTFEFVAEDEGTEPVPDGHDPQGHDGRADPGSGALGDGSRRRALLPRRHRPHPGPRQRSPAPLPARHPDPRRRLRALARGRDPERARDRGHDLAPPRRDAQEPLRAPLHRDDRVPAAAAQAAAGGGQEGAPVARRRWPRCLRRPSCRPSILSPPSAEEAAAQTAAHAAIAQDDPRRMEILEAFTALKHHTHFQVLGLERASTEAQVKEAYFRLARRFHPDVHHDPALADLRDKIEAIFVRLGEAYEVLRNPRIRAKYESQIAPPQGRRPPRPARPRPPPVDPADGGAGGGRRHQARGAPRHERDVLGRHPGARAGRAARRRASRGRKAACCWRAPT